MTMREYTSHLSLWSIFGSPLILSADLRTVKQRHPECEHSSNSFGGGRQLVEEGEQQTEESGCDALTRRVGSWV